LKYVFDNDLHIHTRLSACSGNPEQTPERILQYAKENGLKTICITDHMWDSAVPGASDWYASQNIEHISASKPLPADENVRVLFGCETELDKHMTLGLAPENFDKFDFIVIPTTHLHMKGFTIEEEDASDVKRKAQLWVDRLEAVLNMDLPFHKVGIAHLNTTLIYRNREKYLEIFSSLPEEKLRELFTRAAKLGVGIELNVEGMLYEPEDEEIAMRVFKIAKECGCKFYCASDAHRPSQFDTVKRDIERAVNYLGLTEEDKFILK